MNMSEKKYLLMIFCCCNKVLLSRYETETEESQESAHQVSDGWIRIETFDVAVFRYAQV